VKRLDYAKTTSPAPAPISALWVVVMGFVIVVVVMSLFLGADVLLALGPLVGNGLIVIAWIVGAMGFGLIVLRAMRFECAIALRIVLAIATGLGIVSLITLILGCTGFLNRVSANGILCVGWILALTFVRKPAVSPWECVKRPVQIHWLFLALTPLLGITLLSALLPPGLLWGDEPNGYDVTEYHLQVPREWYEAGKIIPLHHNVFSYFPFNVEMHYLLAMDLRGGPWAGMYLAQLMHASFIVLTVVAVWALLADKHPRGAIVAACIAGATPWLALLAPVAYNEGGLLLFGTLAMGLAMRAIDEPKPLKWMILSGVMAGLACGSKLTAGPMILLPLPMIFAAIQLSKKSQHPMFDVGRSMFAFWIVGFLVFSPWLIRNFVWTHNPVFPEATTIFGKAHWTDTQVERWERANHLPRPDQQNVTGRLVALRDQIICDKNYLGLALELAQNSHLYVPSLVFVVAIVAVCCKRNRATVFLIALLVSQGTFWLFFTHLQSRFFVLSIPIAALLIGRVDLRAFDLTAAMLAILLAIFGTLSITWKIRGVEQRLAPYQIRLSSLIGLPSLRDFSKLPMTDDGKTVELVGEGQAFVYDIPMSRLYYRTVFDVDAQPGDTAEKAWRRGWPPDGTDVGVIRNESELERFHQTYWEIPAP
jgi:4-amino-4-deoxy-L-arabinose transferase-like glycosyltransferase